MNIRKHWKKVVLSCAAVLWAGCGDDSSTQPISTENSNSTEPQSSESKNTSSSDFVQESSSGKFTGSSSNNTIAPLYGIYLPESSSSEAPLRLASDTTVTCKKEILSTTNPLYSTPSCEDLKYSLENEALSVEDIIQKEEDLAKCEGFSEVALYGVPPSISTTKVSYNCSDGKNLPYGKVHIKNGLLYTNEEYNKAFPSSSSSAEELSSSSIENLGCNKTDFVSREDVEKEAFEKVKKTLDSLSNLENASNDLKNCLGSVIPGYYMSYDEPDGFYAKTSKCPDGTTSENEKYTEKKKEYEDLYKEEINICVRNYATQTISGSVDPMKDAVNTKKGDKFVSNGDTCEVVSTYSSWFGEATGYGAGMEQAADEIESKIDTLVNEGNKSNAKRNCLKTVMDQLNRGVALYGPMPEDYPQEIKCSDGIVKETDHYKQKLENYNKGVEEGYTETFNQGNELIDECDKQ